MEHQNTLRPAHLVGGGRGVDKSGIPGSVPWFVVSGGCLLDNSTSHHFTDKEDVIPTASLISAQASENPKQLI